MKIIDETIDRIKYLDKSSSAHMLAHALYSSCGNAPAPSMLDISAKFDNETMSYVVKLLNICNEPDFSNAAQYDAKEWVESSIYWEYIVDEMLRMAAFAYSLEGD